MGYGIGGGMGRSMGGGMGRSMGCGIGGGMGRGVAVAWAVRWEAAGWLGPGLKKSGQGEARTLRPRGMVDGAWASRKTGKER
eukprot:351876-Chlamydomonas_euryale.AAC.1